MRHILTIIVSILIVGTSWAATPPELTFKEGKNHLKISNVQKGGFEFNLSIAKAYLKHAEKKEGNFYFLQTDGFTQSTRIGNPDLPSKGKLIEVPLDANVKIEIVSSEFQIINLNQDGFDGIIVPCQPSVAKCDDGIELPFEMDTKLYSTNQFYADELVKYEESGIMRGTRLGRIEMNPFQYNPVTNELKVYTALEVKVSFDDANYAKTEQTKNIYGNSMFSSLLSKTMNFTNDAKPLNQSEPVKMIIIADRMFEATLAPFVEWKTMTGIETIVRYTDEAEVGSTTSSIKAYLQGAYDAATEENPAASFVLFVGDVQQVPAHSGAAGSHVSDLYYCTYDGSSDIIPDVNYGRFSAQTVTHLENIINKTLLYEKYEMTDPSYLANAVLVAGVDGTYATLHGNGAINYSSIYLNEENGVNAYKYFYPESGSSGSAIIQNISDGVALGNYTAHCSPSGWGNPSFTTSHISGLQNEEKLGLLIGNCCQSNQFNDNECFGEALLRVADKGAIGYIGGSNNTHWDEDYYWATGYGTPALNPNYDDFGNGAYDLVYHLNIEDQPYTQWAPTQSQVNLAGQLAVEESNSSRKTYYWEVYHLMGDPTLMPWIGVPDAMTPSYMVSIPIGLNTLQISNLPEYARVALSDNGELLSTALANQSGVATLDFDAFTIPTTANIVITAQFKQPFIGELEVTPSNEPFIVYDSHTLNDGTAGNGQLDYGETASIDITLRNVGSVSATGVEVTLTTEDTYTTITDGSETMGDAAAETSYTLDGAFTFEVANNVPDQHGIAFILTATDGTNDPWVTEFTIKANAPEFEIAEMALINDDDANGRLDPGETADIVFTVNNTGHANAMNVMGTLVGDSPFFTVMDMTISENITIDASTTYTYNVEASAGTPQGTPVNLIFDVALGEYTDTATEEVVIGQPAEIAIGSGTETSGNYPFYTYYKSNRTQILYLGSEIGAGEINIQELAFDFSRIDTKIKTLTNFKINLIETSDATLGSAYADATSATTVLQSASYTMPQTTGIHVFDIDDFIFDASNNNLIIEITWGVNGAYADYGQYYTVNSTSTAFTSVAYGYSDTETVALYDGNSSVRPNIVLYTENEAPGTMYAANFTVTDGTNPIEGATVMIGSMSQATDATGQTSFDIYEGTYYYSVYADGFGSIVNETMVIDGNIDIPITMGVGIASNLFSDLKLYPNPTNGNVTVELPYAVSGANATVYDLTGKTIATQKCESTITTIDLSDVSEGIYFINIRAGENNTTQKLIINK